MYITGNIIILNWTESLNINLETCRNMLNFPSNVYILLTSISGDIDRTLPIAK